MTDFTVENIDTPASINTPAGFEYLDHPADVILHGWGMSWNETLAKCIEGLSNYMIPFDNVDTTDSINIHLDNLEDDNDVASMCLDEYLFRFTTELFVAKKVKCSYSDTDHTFDCVCFGETFNSDKHHQGTEVKAITCHNLHVYRNSDGKKSHVFIMLDI